MGFLNLGIRGHDIESGSPEQLAKAVAEKNLYSIQLALGKSFPNLYPGAGNLSPGLANYIRNCLNKANVNIAVLGCYFNLIHPDHNERKKGINIFKEHIRYARDFGCSVVATETGNVNSEIVYTKKNYREEPFQEVVKEVNVLVEEAEKFGVIVGIEPGVNHPIYSAKVMKRLLDTVQSNNLQVVLDPANLLTPETMGSQKKVIQEAFQLLGDRIAVIHAKDITIENNKIKEVPIGKGVLNYNVIMEWLKHHKPSINVLMEATKEPFVDQGRDFLLRKFENA